jgi:hypothetical protein
MGGVVDAVVNTVSGTVKAVENIATSTVNLAANITKQATVAALTVTGISYIDKKITGGLIKNTLVGSINSLSTMTTGAINGDWGQFKSGLQSVVTTAVGVASIVAGVVTANPYAIATGVISLDAQYNNGHLLGSGIALTGSIETALTGTHYIEQYSGIIQGLITIASTMYAGSVGGAYLGNLTGLTDAIAQWKTTIDVIGMGYSAYGVYSAVEGIIASQAYWKAKLAEFEEYLKNLQAQKTANDTWFGLMSDPDFCNRIQAGGDLYSFGAGHPLWSVTSVAEPRYLLAIPDTSDTDMDKLIGERYYLSMAGNDNYNYTI